ncbi:hypothetical protein CQW23_03379 [Capsicum baccatum]|uniref:Reverse transcriptase domain-containing protein n=1 Tax=Capsicum baccatum TaxID=33114 RepID=A0A2G2XBP1_CAPBA|nr:hypothetical protein CQW23_03379 [Capsicum baccatum]
MRIEELGLCPPSELYVSIGYECVEFRHACAYRELYSMVNPGVFRPIRGLFHFNSFELKACLTLILCHRIGCALPLSLYQKIALCGRLTMNFSQWEESPYLSSLGLNTFLVGKLIMKRMSKVAFLYGQPLGYYSLWSLFALSHHYVVWLAAKRVYPQRTIPFKDYALLGDDILITDALVAQQYRILLDKLGVTISEA